MKTIFSLLIISLLFITPVSAASIGGGSIGGGSIVLDSNAPSTTPVKREIRRNTSNTSKARVKTRKKLSSSTAARRNTRLSHAKTLPNAGAKENILIATLIALTVYGIRRAKA